MLDAIKRWIAGGPPGPGWSDVSEWARQQGHGFKRARDDEGFVVDGTFGDHSWRLEWGPRQRFALVASDANVGLQWIDPAFTQQLCVVASRLLDHEPPFVVMTLRGRLYLRLQLEEPKAAAVAHALALFQAAATAASNLRGS